MPRKRVIIYAEGEFCGRSSKLAIGVIRYSDYKIVGIIDSTQEGKDVREFLGTRDEIRFYRSIEDTLKFNPEVMIIGVAPREGKLPDAWRKDIMRAIECKIDIYSGLHHFLSEDEEISNLAQKHNVRIWDLREVPDNLPVGFARARALPTKIILTVGSDCAIGKMTATIEMSKEAKRRGISNLFIPTGQTGILCGGFGIAIDRVIGDFMAGACEKLILDHYNNEEAIFVEGQGGIYHPGYSGVTLGILHGTMPTHMILCHDPRRTCVKDSDIPLPDLNKIIKAYELLTLDIRPARVVGIALNCSNMTDEEALIEIERIESKTSLPATDCVKFGASKLIDAIWGNIGNNL